MKVCAPKNEFSEKNELDCHPDHELVQVFYGGKSFHLNKEDLSLKSNDFLNVLQDFHPNLEITKEELGMAHGKIHQLYFNLKTFFFNHHISMPPVVRLDCVVKNNQLHIMEIEGIDPYIEIGEAQGHDSTKEVVKWYADEILRQFSIHKTQAL